ncbi:MAG: TolC family protein [Candidatus Methylomirabilales bacterium]
MVVTAVGIMSLGLHAEAAEKVVLSLDQAVERALLISPEIEETRFDVEAARAKKTQADAARFPQLELLGITGPSPEARLADSTDVNSTGDSIFRPTIDGIFGRATLRLVQPIYTFGKISSFREAAAHGVRVSQAQVDEKAAQVILRTKELYYGLLLAEEIKGLLLGLQGQLRGALEKVERQLEAGSPGADQIDLFKLRSFLGQIQKGINESDKGINLSREALRAFLNLDPAAEVNIADKALRPLGRSPAEVEQYIREARELRPEFVQLKEGLRARRALVEAERASFFPDFFLAFFGDFAAASNRDTLNNPFIVDEFNHATAGVVAGVKWSFDFGITRGRVDEARAGYRRLLQTQVFADRGIPLQVKKAHEELLEAQKNIEATETAYRNARKWLVAAAANMDLGIGEVKDVADAVKAFAENRVENLRAMYNERLSFANLAFATGRDIQAYARQKP